MKRNPVAKTLEDPRYHQRIGPNSKKMIRTRLTERELDKEIEEWCNYNKERIEEDG